MHETGRQWKLNGLLFWSTNWWMSSSCLLSSYPPPSPSLLQNLRSHSHCLLMFRNVSRFLKHIIVFWFFYFYSWVLLKLSFVPHWCSMQCVCGQDTQHVPWNRQHHCQSGLPIICLTRMINNLQQTDQSWTIHMGLLAFNPFLFTFCLARMTWAIISSWSCVRLICVWGASFDRLWLKTSNTRNAIRWIDSLNRFRFGESFRYGGSSTSPGPCWPEFAHWNRTIPLGVGPVCPKIGLSLTKRYFRFAKEINGYFFLTKWIICQKGITILFLYWDIFRKTDFSSIRTTKRRFVTKTDISVLRRTFGISGYHAGILWPITYPS